MILRSLKCDTGFTLIETMIAVVIFAAVSAAGVSVLSGYTSGTRVIASADDFSAGLSKFHSLLSDDMAHFVSRPVRGAEGGTEAPFNMKPQDKESLFHIVRLAPISTPEGDEIVEGVRLIEYRLTDGMLVRRTYNHADRLRVTGFFDEPLISGIEKLDVRYQKNSVWLTDWLPVSTAADTPDLVEISATFTGKGTVTSVYKLKGSTL